MGSISGGKAQVSVCICNQDGCNEILGDFSSATFPIPPTAVILIASLIIPYISMRFWEISPLQLFQFLLLLSFLLRVLSSRICQRDFGRFLLCNFSNSSYCRHSYCESYHPVFVK